MGFWSGMGRISNAIGTGCESIATPIEMGSNNLTEIFETSKAVNNKTKNARIQQKIDEERLAIATDMMKTAEKAISTFNIKVEENLSEGEKVKKVRQELDKFFEDIK